jgi:membrane protein required for colicin V production
VNPLDIILLALVAVSLAAGLFKGLIREVFSLVGLVLGILVALVLAPVVAPTLERVIVIKSAAYAAAFLLLFVATLIVAGLLGALLTRLIEVARLGGMNRLLGGIFGLVRGVLTAMILALGLTLLFDPQTPLLAESRVLPHLEFGARLLAPLLPEGAREELLQHLEALPPRKPAVEVENVGGPPTPPAGEGLPSFLR